MDPLYTSALLACFLASCGLSFFLTPRLRDLAIAWGIVTPPELDRHVHTGPVPRLGGVAIYFSLMLVLVAGLFVAVWLGIAPSLSLKSMVGLLGPAAIVFLLGLYDDLYSANAYVKFSVQAVAAVLLYFAGYGVQHFDLFSSSHVLSTALGLPVTVFWVLLVTNAFNLIDGLDGLAAGSALFSTIVLLIMLLLAPNRLLVLMTCALAGAIVGFLRFNFYPASIFLGDSGSLFIGFLLSAVALAGSEKAPTFVALAIPIVSLGLPILDVGLAVARRLLGGRPLFTGDTDHIHHKLLKRGFSQRDAVLILYAATAAFGFLSLVLFNQRGGVGLVLAIVGIGIWVGVQQLNYPEFSHLSSIFDRIARRRQIVANNLVVGRACELLKECRKFGAICDVLESAFQPVGFEGIRLDIPHTNGLSPSSFQPLIYKRDGRLEYSWSEQVREEDPSVIRLELVTSSRKHRGYISLFPKPSDFPPALDMDILNNGFRTSLANAVDRACTLLERQKVEDSESPRGEQYKVAVGSSAD
jgi:UDP-GlcNAc:undecaprenyl-phosphate GlcNAc-1-phosphate transferase